MTKPRAAMAVGIVGVLVLAGCGGSGASSSSTASTSTASASTLKVSAKAIPGLGTVLVNGQGMTLYSFAPDKRAKVTCTGACAAVWPPMKLPGGQQPVATGGVKSSLLGSDSDPSGGRVVTYDGWPLYTYVADKSPGQATGQALNLNGGLWYVLAPSGAVVHKKPSGSGY
jgi:predicted lipoprotein with Yx(FWY)xxD motif